MKYKLIEADNELKILSPTGDIITTEEALTEILNLTKQIADSINLKK